MHRLQFVSDGRCRLEAAIVLEIRATVEAEFAERLGGASPWERVWLRYLLGREVRRRVRDFASKEALF